MVTLINTPWFTLSIKRCWGLHYSNEAGLTCVQVGPFITEIS